MTTTIRPNSSRERVLESAEAVILHKSFTGTFKKSKSAWQSGQYDGYFLFQNLEINTKCTKICTTASSRCIFKDLLPPGFIYPLETINQRLFRWLYILVETKHIGCISAILVVKSWPHKYKKPRCQCLWQPGCLGKIRGFPSLFFSRFGLLHHYGISSSML